MCIAYQAHQSCGGILCVRFVFCFPTWLQISYQKYLSTFLLHNQTGGCAIMQTCFIPWPQYRIFRPKIPRRTHSLHGSYMDSNSDCEPCSRTQWMQHTSPGVSAAKPRLHHENPDRGLRNRRINPVRHGNCHQHTFSLRSTRRSTHTVAPTPRCAPRTSNFRLRPGRRILLALTFTVFASQPTQKASRET